jgi:hypothetical protein
VKKILIFRPRKVQDKIEFSDEIPRRWKEPANSPHKNQHYFDARDTQEYGTLRQSMIQQHPQVSNRGLKLLRCR